MRDYLPALIGIAILANVALVITAMAVDLVNTLDTFLLVWLIPNLIFTTWTCVLYHRSK